MGTAFYKNFSSLYDSTLNILCNGMSLAVIAALPDSEYYLFITSSQCDIAIHKRYGCIGTVKRPLQLVDAGQVDLLLFILGQFRKECEDFVKLRPHFVRVVLRHFIRQGGDQVLNGADTALIPAGLAGVGLGIAALAVMSVLAVQQVFRIRANLVIIAAVRIGERPQGVALVRMLMAAGLTLAGAM